MSGCICVFVYSHPSHFLGISVMNNKYSNIPLATTAWEQFYGRWWRSTWLTLRAALKGEICVFSHRMWHSMKAATFSELVSFAMHINRLIESFLSVWCMKSHMSIQSLSDSFSVLYPFYNLMFIFFKLCCLCILSSVPGSIDFNSIRAGSLN